MRKLTYIIFCISVFALQFYAQQPTLEWERRFVGFSPFYGSGGKSVRTDSLGNVYVLVKAASDTSHGDYCVIKYSSSGNQIWTALYNSPGNYDDFSTAFDVTKAGDVYITGYTSVGFIPHITTVKFNSAGVFQWAGKLYDGTWCEDLKICSNGDIVIAGTGSGETIVAKYAPNGDTLWKRRNPFGPYSSYLNSVVTDDSGNVYAAGYTMPDSLRTHFLILKYNSAGVLQWYKTYYYDTNYQVDYATCIAIDANRNVYAAGSSGTTVPGFNANSLLKISPDGLIRWAKTYNGIGENNRCGNTPTGVSVLSDGSRIYYTTVCGNSNSTEFITLAYGSFGDSLWIRRYPIGGLGIPLNNPSDLKLDKNNSVYIAGSLINPGGGRILKYTSGGVLQWVATTDSSSPKRIYIDTNFNIYYAGSGGFNNVTNAVLIKYSQIIGIVPNANELPVKFMLFQNYPNPFNSTTIINYEIPVKSFVRLNIYNALGQLVGTLVNKEHQVSYYTIVLNSENLSSGVYFYSLIINNELKSTKKFIVIK